MNESELVDVELEIRIDNPDKKAIAFTAGGDKLVWLARSLIEVHQEGKTTTVDHASVAGIQRRFDLSDPKACRQRIPGAGT